MSLDEKQQVQEDSVFEQNAEAPEATDTQADQSQDSGNSQSEGTNGTKPAEAQPQSFKDLSDEEIESSDAPTPLKRALRRANRRLHKERQATAELKAEIEAIKQQLGNSSRSQEAESMLRELEGELGLDSESTAKFYKAVDKIVSKKAVPQQNVPVANEKQAKFVSKVQAARSQYEDWDDMAPYMHKVMQDEMKQLNELGLDPEDAYDQSVHQYYAKAVRLKTQQELMENRQKQVSQSNANNRASSESSRNGTGKPVPAQRITQDVYDKNRKNPQWVKDNYQKIIDAASAGLIRSR